MGGSWDGTVAGGALERIPGSAAAHSGKFHACHICVTSSHSANLSLKQDPPSALVTSPLTRQPALPPLVYSELLELDAEGSQTQSGESGDPKAGSSREGKQAWGWACRVPCVGRVPLTWPGGGTEPHTRPAAPLRAHLPLGSHTRCAHAG